MTSRAASLASGTPACPSAFNLSSRRAHTTRPLIGHASCKATPHSVNAASVLTTVEVQEAGAGPTSLTGPANIKQLGKLLPDGAILFTADELQSLQVELPTATQVQARTLAQPVLEPEQATAVVTKTEPAPITEAAQAPTASVEVQPATAPVVPESQPTSAPAAPPAPVQQQPVQARGASSIDWAARRRQRVVQEIMEAAERSNRRGTVRKGFRPITTRSSDAPRYDPKQIEAGLMQLEMLLPGFQPNLDAMPAEQWAQLALDVNGAAARVVALKASWPGIDLSVLLTNYPKALMLTPEQIAEDATKVRELLRNARNPDAIVQSVPVMLTPQVAASVLVTITKWFPKREPVEVLEQDPDLVRRAQEMDQPFEPVYEDEKGNWVVPGANRSKRPDWAQHIAAQQKNTQMLREQQMQQRAAKQQQQQ